MKFIKNIMRLSFPIIAALLSFILFSACEKSMQSNTGSTYTLSSNSTAKKYLALGDSYTIGQSVSVEERFPVQTKSLLGEQNIVVNAPDIIATTGWTTGNLLSALSTNPPAKDYDFVTLLIGVNNQYQGRSLDEYKSDFTEILTKAILYAGSRKNRVFVLSIPDYSVTPFAQGRDTSAIARQVDTFNLANKTITAQFGVTYIDITPISREARTDPSLIANDGLHPSGNQYKRWGALLEPLIKAAL